MELKSMIAKDSTEAKVKIGNSVLLNRKKKSPVQGGYVRSVDTDNRSEYDKAKEEAYDGPCEEPFKDFLRPKSIVKRYDVVARRPFVSHRLV